MLRKSNPIVIPILLTVSYVVFLYFYLEYLWANNLLISLKGTEPINLWVKFIDDFLSNLLIVILLLISMVLRKRPLSEVGLTFKSSWFIAILFTFYIGMFIVNGDYSSKGFYIAFFYLVIVAFSEEFIFRGYLFSAIDKEHGFRIAVVLSGILFGGVHAFIPAILNQYNYWEFMMAILSNLLGQGILASAIFALLYKKSKTLFVPVLIHAILDYSSVLF